MNNSSKQILLSVIGIAILVIAVVGVSFAFFTYSKTGGTVNKIVSGKIYLAMSDTKDITLENAFPESDNTGTSHESFVFTVNGYIDSSNASDQITYSVYAMQGEELTGKTRFLDKDIKIRLSATNNIASGQLPVINENLINTLESARTVASIGTLPATGETYKIADGVITKGRSGSQETHTYSLNIWISSDVTIGEETDTTGTYSTYSQEDFADKYYSIKVKVVGNG